MTASDHGGRRHVLNGGGSSMISKKISTTSKKKNEKGNDLKSLQPTTISPTTMRRRPVHLTREHLKILEHSHLPH